jgi:hypothetical protein
MIGKTCGVRIYGPRIKFHCCEHGCENCRIGCFAPARYRNPFFGKEFWDERYWWRGMYSGIEYLCAEHYDEMVSELKEEEDLRRRWQGDEFEENPEFTKILETL